MPRTLTAASVLALALFTPGGDEDEARPASPTEAAATGDPDA
jgi:hypothetical protein